MRSIYNRENKHPRHVALTFPKTYNRILRSPSIYEDNLSKGLLIFTLISESLRISSYLFKNNIEEITLDLLPRKLIEKLHIDIDTIEHILIRILYRLENIKPTVVIFDDTSVRKIVFTNTENKMFKLNIVVGYDYEIELKRALETSIRRVIQTESSDLQKMSKMLKENLVVQNDPDLIIIFGEEKFPNFIPLNLAYSELSFINKEIAEVTERDIEQALQDYRRRQRRFGR